MKKFLISLILLLVLAGGYFGYTKWWNAPKVSAWDFIPQNAAIVLETDQTLSTYDSISSLGVWRAFDDTDFIEEIESKLIELDSIDPENGIAKVFENTSSLMAFFPVSVSAMDVLFVVKSSTSAQRNYIKRCVQHFQNSNFRSKRRTYNGFNIQEMYQRTGGPTFSFVQHGDFFVGSFTSFLVEDAVRALINPEQQSFNSTFRSIRELKPLDQDEGNIYLNISEVSNLLNLFPSNGMNPQLGKASFLDVKFEPSSVKLTGFTFPKNDFLSTFTGGPGGFDLLDIVPNNTAKMEHYSFEDGTIWRKSLIEFDPEITTHVEALKSKFDIDADFLFNQIDHEIAVIDLEAIGRSAPDQLILFDVKDVNEADQFLRQAAVRMAGDSLFNDSVEGFELRKLNVDLSRALLGERSTLDRECYYLIYREHVIMSNSLVQLKRLISSLQSDNTWRRSLKINRLLNIANGAANYSVFINVPRSWNQLMNSLKDDWKPFFLRNESGFKSLEYLSFQYSKVDDKFYTNFSAFQPEPPKQPAKVTFDQQATFVSPIITKPFLFRSHENQSLEVIAQDSALQIYHISSDFKILWAKRLTEPIVGSVISIDYYNNNKKQYAFSTATRLHIIDRTGAYIEGFPKTIPSRNPIEHFSVVDYDGSKNYRFMCTDNKGEIYLLDKAGVALNGWAPKSMGNRLTTSPEHIRVAGKDAFIVVNKGRIDLLSRRGSSYPGFPLDTKSDLVGRYFTEASGSFETSKLTTLTDGGEIIRINFGGRIEFREQLVKPDAETTFELVPDVLENTFLIVRSSDNLWEVLDASGSKLFEKTYLKKKERGMQFYNFGGGKTIVLSTDFETGFVSIFDLDGNPISQRPLRSDNLSSVIFSENQGAYSIYLASEKEIKRVNIR